MGHGIRTQVGIFEGGTYICDSWDPRFEKASLFLTRRAHATETVDEASSTVLPPRAIFGMADAGCQSRLDGTRADVRACYCTRVRPVFPGTRHRFACLSFDARHAAVNR